MDSSPGNSQPGTPGGSNGGIFIKNVLPDSPAGRTGKLFTGDRLLEISGVPLNTSDHTVAVNAIKEAGDPVRFVVQSLNRQQFKSPKTLKASAAASPEPSIMVSEGRSRYSFDSE